MAFNRTEKTRLPKMIKRLTFDYRKFYVKFRDAHDRIYNQLAGSGPFTNLMHFQYLPARGAKLVERALLSLDTSHKVLDVGCGTKPFSRIRPDLNWLGIDIVAGPEVDIVVGQTAKWPIDDNSIDFVLCTSVLEHVESPQHVISEITRVCRPGGKILLSVPFLYPIHGAPQDFWRLTSEGLAIWLPNLRIMEQEKFGKLGTVLGTYFNIYLRSIFYGKPILNGIRMLALPLNFIITLLINLVSLGIDKLDPTDIFPLGTHLIAKKPENFDFS